VVVLQHHCIKTWWRSYVDQRGVMKTTRITFA
jgi:hypothetical protein